MYMWDIVAFQYKISEIILQYISGNIFPYFQALYPEIIIFSPEYFRIFEIPGILFITTFILSLITFFIGRIIGKIIWFHTFRPEKYRLVLFLNIFYIVPFFYGLIWGKFNIINIVLIFLWSGAYFSFKYVISHPDMVIDYLTLNGIYL